jgi:hypothetical protein
VSLHDLYSQYHNRVQFIVIYIREAHPVDGWWLGEDSAQQQLIEKGYEVVTDVYDPKTIEERQVVARRCEVNLQYDIHTYVDDMDDTVSKAYAARPTRLYLIGSNGRVSYAGGLGPFGFKPEELKAAIDEYLAQ